MKKLVILFIILSVFLAGCGWFTEMGRNNPFDPDSAWIASHTPAAGATSVALTAAVTVTFLRELDTATLTADTFTLTTGDETVEGTLTYSDTDKVLTFTPSSSLSYAATYTATLPAAGIADLEGTSLLAEYTWSFTTVGAPAPPEPSGSLDKTFGGSGFVSEDKYSGSNEYGRAMTLDDEDGVLIAGYEGSHGRGTVIRYTEDGVLDDSFTGGFSAYSTDGYVEFTGFDSENYVRTIAHRSDGKIIVAGIDGSSRVRITCLTSSGAADGTFDGDESMSEYPYNGEVYFYPEDGGTGCSNPYIEKAISLPGGKTILAGYAQVGSYYSFMVLKFNTDGSLDTTFGGGDGCVTFNDGSSIYATSAALDGEGRIVVCGYDASSNGFLARFTSAGVLDTTFHSVGYVVDDRTDSIDYSDVAVASDGSIVVAGHNTSDYYSIVLARYNEDGTLDDTFDGDSAGNGKIAIDPDSNPSNTYTGGGSDDIHIALDGEDRIILCGTVSDSFSDAFIIRLTTVGMLDTSFDGEESMDSYPGNGYLRIDIGSSADYLNAVAVDSEGRIVVAGEYDDNGNYYPMALRLWP